MLPNADITPQILDSLHMNHYLLIEYWLPVFFVDNTEKEKKIKI